MALGKKKKKPLDCANCVYMIRDGETLTCRRYPPIGSRPFTFTGTKAEWWCGEGYNGEQYYGHIAQVQVIE